MAQHLVERTGELPQLGGHMGQVDALIESRHRDLPHRPCHAPQRRHSPPGNEPSEDRRQDDAHRTARDDVAAEDTQRLHLLGEVGGHRDHGPVRSGLVAILRHHEVIRGPLGAGPALDAPRYLVMAEHVAPEFGGNSQRRRGIYHSAGAFHREMQMGMADQRLIQQMGVLLQRLRRGEFRHHVSHQFHLARHLFHIPGDHAAIQGVSKIDADAAEDGARRHREHHGQAQREFHGKELHGDRTCA